jgi:hypothetical protein
MPETFLILLAGGILLAAAVSDPKQVTLQWLRLCGILALAMAGLSMFFLFRRTPAAGGEMWIANGVFAAVVLGQLAFVQIAQLRWQHVLSWLAFFVALKIGAEHLRVAMPPHAGQPRLDAVIAYLAAAGVAAMCGLILMDMLLGHAYLTASKMTMAPFRRLNAVLAAVIIARVLVAMGATTLMQRLRPVYMLWGQYGILILTRWIVGLVVPAIFVYMASDCIKRRSTQSATGILYVAGVLVFIGEMVALYLVQATGLPF